MNRDDVRRITAGVCALGLVGFVAGCGSSASAVAAPTPAATSYGWSAYAPLSSDTALPTDTPLSTSPPPTPPPGPAPVRLGTTVHTRTPLAALDMTLTAVRDPATGVVRGTARPLPAAGGRFIGLVFAFRTSQANPEVASQARILLFGSDGQSYSPDIRLQIPGCGDVSPDTTAVAQTGKTTGVCLVFPVPTGTHVQRVQFLEPVASTGLTPVAEWSVS